MNALTLPELAALWACTYVTANKRVDKMLANGIARRAGDGYALIVQGEMVQSLRSRKPRHVLGVAENWRLRCWEHYGGPVWLWPWNVRRMERLEVG